jgi:hypothetical protein
MPFDLGRAVSWALDAVSFVEDRLGFCPDPWQARVLRSRAPQIIQNCGRQVGKSTVVSALALHTALYTPGALILVIAPSQRQSRELFIKIHTFLQSLEPAEATQEETKLTLMLNNGSRVVTLPGDNPRTIRGFSAPALILMDEAAFIHDETFDVTIPMLAAAPEGRIILMSTPYISAGFFYQIWHGTGDWERYELKTSECPRVAREWLEARKREEPLRFGREYECRFGSPEDSLFTPEMLDRMVAHDFEPLSF